MPHPGAGDLVRGRATFVAGVRLRGRGGGAWVRPPIRGAKLRSLDDSAARAMPGVIAVVRQGDVVGVVADRDEQARAAAGAVVADWNAIPVEGPTAEVPMQSDAEVDP